MWLRTLDADVNLIFPRGSWSMLLKQILTAMLEKASSILFIHQSWISLNMSRIKTAPPTFWANDLKKSQSWKVNVGSLWRMKQTPNQFAEMNGSLSSRSASFWLAISYGIEELENMLDLNTFASETYTSLLKLTAGCSVCDGLQRLRNYGQLFKHSIILHFWTHKSAALESLFCKWSRRPHYLRPSMQHLF